MNGKKTGKNMKTKSSGQFNPSINRLLSFILSISILLTVAAPFAEPQTVEANWVTKTVGALIASLVLNSGAPNVETDYVNYLKSPSNSVMQIEIPNDGGVTSLPPDLASQIDTALETAPLSVQRSLQPFETTAADVAIMNHALTEAGADPTALNLQPATVGENIAASAQELQNTGNVNPSFGGQAFGALQGIISGGAQTILGQKIRESVSITKNLSDIEYVKGLYDNGQIDETEYTKWMSGKVNTAQLKTINTGSNIGIDQTKLNNIIPNSYYFGVQSNYPGSPGTSRFLSGYIPNTGNLEVCVVTKLADNTSGVWTYVINKGSTATIRMFEQYTNSSGGYEINKNQLVGAHNKISYSGGAFRTVGYTVGDVKIFNSMQDFENYATSFYNSPAQDPIAVKSPSIVGKDGQMTANLNINPNINYYTTNQAPIYNYNNYTMEPVDLDEYLQFAQSIQQQIGNQTPQAQISEAVEQYVNQHLVSEPIPTTAPSEPVIPDQPTPDPKPTGTPEQHQENQEIMATPELKDKFPFCIPWDVYYAFAVLEDQREAPALDFDLDLGLAGTHHIEIDFADWEDIASLLRLLELLAFIIGLAIATKRLMGGTGA